MKLRTPTSPHTIETPGSSSACSARARCRARRAPDRARTARCQCVAGARARGRPRRHLRQRRPSRPLASRACGEPAASSSTSCRPILARILVARCAEFASATRRCHAVTNVEGAAEAGVLFEPQRFCDGHGLPWRQAITLVLVHERIGTTEPMSWSKRIVTRCDSGALLQSRSANLCLPRHPAGA